jgi:hypothetical protein
LLAEQDGLAEVVFQVVQVLIVPLTDVFDQLTRGVPWNVPSDFPGFGVSTRIVDEGFVVQSTSRR